MALEEISVDAYLSKLGSAISSKNGRVCASLLYVDLEAASKSENRGPIARELVNLQRTNERALMGRVNRTVQPETMAEAVTSFVKALAAVLQGDFEAAYEAEVAGFIKFLDYFRKETNWLVPVLHVWTHDTRLLAIKADEQKSKKSGVETVDTLRNAEPILKRGFSLTVNDRAELSLSKKTGSLYIVNQLFKIYFRLNTLRLCKNLMRAVEAPNYPDFSRFGKRDSVTYKFYAGRLSMFEDQYKRAEEELSFALKHCHKDSTKNIRAAIIIDARRLILQYLIPVKLLLGRLPHPQYLRKHNLVEFEGIASAVRLGNLRQFNESLAKYQEVFVRRGIYLILEKVKILVYRNLFKKIYLILNTNKIRIGYLAKGLKWMGADLEIAEIECILANLIFKGYIRGYMSHEKQFLVVSQKNAFPSIQDVMT